MNEAMINNLTPEEYLNYRANDEVKRVLGAANDLEQQATTFAKETGTTLLTALSTIIEDTERLHRDSQDSDVTAEIGDYEEALEELLDDLNGLKQLCKDLEEQGYAE